MLTHFRCAYCMKVNRSSLAGPHLPSSSLSKWASTVQNSKTTPDFLTSLTSSSERRPREGFEHSVPTTPAAFAQRWKESKEYAALQEEITAFEQRHPVHSERLEEFTVSRRAQQSKHVYVSFHFHPVHKVLKPDLSRPTSPYTLSFASQIRLCLRRSWWRLKADPTLTASQIFGNTVMALILASVFFNLRMYTCHPTNYAADGCKAHTTSSFYQRGALLFFAILLNAFGSALEVCCRDRVGGDKADVARF